MKNHRSFWNWQGNQLSYWSGTGYVVVGIILISLILIAIFRSKLNNFFTSRKDKKILKIATFTTFLQVLGILMLIIQVVRTTLMNLYSYPNVWESIPLHICRMHVWLLAIFLSFRKIEWLKYIAYLAFLGGIMGIGFGHLHVSTEDLHEKGSVWAYNGIEFYDSGPDNMLFWDFFIAHYLICVLPMAYVIVSKKKIEIVTYFRIIFFYFIGAIAIWFIDYGMSFISNPLWKANYWYLGTNEINAYHTAMGPITTWPQNIILVPFATFLLVYVTHIAVLSVKGNGKKDIKEFFISHKKIENYKQIFSIKLTKK